jgi:hypothetical protein
MNFNGKATQALLRFVFRNEAESFSSRVGGILGFLWIPIILHCTF